MTAPENDTPPPSPALPPSEPSAPPVAARSRARKSGGTSWLGIGLALALIVIIALGAALWRQQQLVDAIGRESARRLDGLEAQARDAQARARQALSAVQGNTDRLGVLESRQLEAQSQQAALEQLYQEVSRDEDEWTLIEVEQALMIASQQLQLAGNVANAIAALQSADSRLARADRPQFMPVRKAIAQDLDTLRGLPSVDLSGLVVKIDQLVSVTGRLPLLVTVEPSVARRAPGDEAAAAPVPAVAGDAPWWHVATRWWPSLRDGLLHDMRDLVRIQRVDQPAGLLMSPEQGALLREQLKLRLLNARLALLARQEHAWRTDLDAVAEGFKQYFDTGAPSVVAAQALLSQVREAPIAIQLPGINDSLAAVRSILPRSAAPAASQR